jgi:hypothetical protein
MPEPSSLSKQVPKVFSGSVWDEKGYDWIINRRAEARRTIRIVGAGNIDGVGLGGSVRHPFGETPLNRLAKELRPVIGGAFVYVISDFTGTEVKIGKATSPQLRLATLQTGNPNKLFIHRAFFFFEISTTESVESASHIGASRAFKRLQGEWFRCSPYEAYKVIEAAAVDNADGYVAFTPIIKERTE